MSRFVVDASVAIKWFTPEVHSDKAIRLRQPAHDLHVPTFFAVEVGNIPWKKVRRQELALAEAESVLSRLPTLPLREHPDGPLVPAAFALAEQTGRTVYDCLYLALAIHLGGRMVTADERFRNALATTALASHLCWVEDIP